MNHILFSDEEVNNEIHIKVIVREQKNAIPYVPVIVVSEEDVLKYCRSKNLPTGKTLKGPSIHNKRNHNREGIWIFEKKQVDNSEKQVTLKEEKPKTTRKRRTKKVSTEE